MANFFSKYTESEKRRIVREITTEILPRPARMCNILERGEYKFVYRRYASLYFVVGVPPGLNELLVLEQIHLFVEALDGYFNSGELFPIARLCAIWFEAFSWELRLVLLYFKATLVCLEL